MKMLRSVILFICLFLLYNCSEKQENYDNIVGKWEFVSSIPNAIETSSVIKTSRIKKSLKEKADPDSKFFMELDAEGKGVNFMGNKEGEYHKSHFTYIIKKGNIFITDSSKRVTEFKIDSITNDKLELLMNLTNYYKKEFPDIKVAKVTSIITYKRVEEIDVKTHQP